MSQVYLKRFWYVFLLVAMQVLVLGHIHLWGYATPLLGVMFVLCLPINANRIVSMVAAFSIGVVLDMFSNSPGVAASAMTLTAFVQQPLLRNMVQKDNAEDVVPSLYTLGASTYIWYVLILLTVHHVTYFVMEAMSFIDFLSLVISIISSMFLTFILVMTIEVFRKR